MSMYEEEAKRALSEWASSKYALFKGMGLTWQLPSAFGSRGLVEADGSTFRKFDRSKPYLVGDVHCIDRIDEDTFVAMWYQLKSPDPSTGLTEITRDYEKNWEVDLGSGGAFSGADYNPHSDTVLSARDDEVIEVDRSGNILRTLGSAGGNDFSGYLRQITWDRRMWDLAPSERGVWVSDRDNHWVALANFNGDLLWDFGVYGTSGSDDTHLNQPLHASAGYTESDGIGSYVAIADNQNHRVLLVDFDTKNVLNRVMYPCPTWSMIHQNSLVSITGWKGEYGPPLFVNKEKLRWGRLPIFDAVNSIRVYDDRILTCGGAYTKAAAGGAFEIDLSRYNFWLPQRNPTFYDAETLSANETVTSPPIVPFGLYDVTVYFIATQDASYDVEVARTDATAFKSWETYHSSPTISANTLDVTKVTGGSYMLRVKPTMGGTSGDVSMWAVMEPKK